MATVTDLRTARKPARVTHYATYGDVSGTAELLTGSGYLFRREGERTATLVSYKDPELILHGLVDLAADTDERPLWMRLADPGYYEGTTRRGTLAGR